MKPVDVVRVAEHADAALRRLERPHTANLRRYLNEAHRRVQRDLRSLYSLALDETKLESRVFREARARAILVQLDATLATLDLGSPSTGVPRAMRDVVVLGSETGLQRVAELLAQFSDLGALGIGAQMNLPAIEAQVVNSAARLTRYSAQAVDKINQAVIDGLVQGKGARVVARDVRAAVIGEPGVPGGLAFQAETIARTELMSSLEIAQQEAMWEAGIDMAVWIATPDERTCEFCASRSGEAYALDDLILPAHPRCRCTSTPIKREWLEAGYVDVAALRAHQADVRAEYELAHGKDARYTNRPSPFEGAAGLEQRPAAVWTP